MSLAADEVHVWRASLATSLGADQLSALSAEEEDRAERFSDPKRRHGFLVARTALREILAAELGDQPGALRFAAGPHGKPFLDPPGALRFNLSHSGEVVLCAVARAREVGVDVELTRSGVDPEALARRFFSPSENEQLASLPPPLRRDAFFAGWTRKEALVKAWGVGLSLPFDRFDVSLLPQRPAELLGVREGPGRLARWSVHELDVGPGYAAALATEGSVEALTWRRWPQDEAEPAPR